MKKLAAAPSPWRCSAACSTSRRIKVQIVHPAEVNLSGSVAISALNGDRGGEVATLLEEKLLETGGRFQIIDRSHMGAVMAELKLSASDLAQQSNVVKLGKLMTAQSIISAELVDGYHEEPKQKNYKDAQGRMRTVTTWQGEATLRADFKIVDVSTGQLLLARVIESKKSWGGQFGQGLATILSGQQEGQKPDREKLEKDAREEVVQKLVAAVAPRKEYGEAEFETDSAIPQLEGGIGWASRGEWKRAQDNFNEGVHAAENNPKISSKTLAKGYLDAGLAYVYAGDYDSGMKLLSKAYDLSQDTKVLDRIDQAKQLQADAGKYAAQTAAPASN